MLRLAKYYLMSKQYSPTPMSRLLGFRKMFYDLISKPNDPQTNFAV